ncbi:protein CYSTEINE-RICH TRANSMEMBRANE MODULE 6-like [Oryza glaberrima]|uniref:protein CYSTEINE-RICH TRANSMEMBRANE MODULE 6-like n=1 Tax=Oryza glaberrima TaxID=4538 RepID=UPI00224C2B1F|nr:protein CYSTEINE-RICH TRANSMEMBRANE MODULE 6-like [Oryza glaberrima]
MDYSKQGSWDSYSSQVHNLYPYPQPRVYPPPPVSEGYGYQTYFGEDNQEASCGWSQQQPSAPSDGPYNYGYNDDPDCLTFLRGCLAGFCCCCLLERCCYF